MEFNLQHLNATQLARLYVTLRELGRNTDAQLVANTGCVNCGSNDWAIEVKAVENAVPEY